MKKFFIAAPLLAPFLFSPVHTQVNGNLAGVIAQLLDHPAPPPPPPKELAEAMAAMNGNALYYYYTSPPDPGEDAPIKVLMAYWEMQARGDTGKQPSEKVRQRLLQACEEEPEFPGVLLDFLPNTPDAHARVKRTLDEGQDASIDPLDLLGSYWRQDSRRGLRKWLMRNSEYQRDELIREASGVKDDDSYVKGSRELAALARLDWRAAEPLLKDYADGAAPLAAVFALGLLCEHAGKNNQSVEAGAYRDRLKRVVSDPQAPGRARAMAVEALMKADWQGRDEWFLSLFADSALGEMEDGYRTIHALAEPVKHDPDRWIPIISQLIGHGDRNVHNAAALCLAKFVDHRARRDALLPLLPWLSDQQWAVTLDEFVRARLAESVIRLKMHEALPELISILRNKESNHYSRHDTAGRAPRSGSIFGKEIYFTSDDMWVDEAAQRIYLAYHGHLLRLPLIVNPKSSGK